MAVETLMDKPLHITVITPARAVFDADAKALVVPAFDGELGVLPGHAAMLALLGTGELRVTSTDDTVKHLAIRGGFLQVDRNKVTILTPESASPADVKPDVLQAEAQKLSAEKVVKLEDHDAQDIKRSWLKARQKLLNSK